MPRDDYLDNNELLILLAIMGLGDNAYGVTIRERLQEKVGRDLARSVIYDVLERLEKRGLVESRLGKPTRERGGRAKRFFNPRGNAIALVRQTLQPIDTLKLDLALSGVASS